MPDMLADGAAWLVDKLAAHASQTVTYRRGGQVVTGGVAATEAPVRAESDPDVNIDINHRDFIIKAALLVINGVQITPKKNDQIVKTNGDIFDVLPLGNEPEYRDFDKDKNAYRIHTKRTTEG